MSLDVPIFYLKTLKKYFYYFFAGNIIVVSLSFLLVGLFDNRINPSLINSANTWVAIGMLFVITSFFGQRSKRELKALLEIKDYTEQFSLYENYFKKKLIWNGISIILSGTFWVLTEKNTFFYVLILQLILSVVFYPNRKLIAKELKNTDIVFV
jgi:hypothetical protein